jgi:hypothetical protein
MKKTILILFVSLFLFGCYDKPPNGYVWLMEMQDGRTFEVTASNRFENTITVQIKKGLFMNISDDAIKSFVLVKKAEPEPVTLKRKPCD